MKYGLHQVENDPEVFWIRDYGSNNLGITKSLMIPALLSNTYFHALAINHAYSHKSGFLMHSITFKNIFYYRPRSKGDNRLGSICLSVHLSACALLLEQHGNYKSTKFVCLSVISGRSRLRQCCVVDWLLILRFYLSKGEKC